MNKRIIHEVIIEKYAGKSVNIFEVDSGYSREVFKCVIDGKELFVRVRREDLSPLMQVYEIIENSEVPTSRLFDFWFDIKTNHWIMIRNKVSGEPIDRLSKSLLKNQILFKYGEILQRIHSIPVSGYGKLNFNDEKMLYGVSNSWGAHMNTWQKPWDSLLAHGYITQEQVDLVQNIYRKIELAGARSSLLHQDFHGSHLFFDGDLPTGVIDFSKCIAGDPNWDLAISLFYLDEQEQKFFLNGYGDDYDGDILKNYMFLIAVDKTIWSHSENLDIFEKQYEKMNDLYAKFDS